MAKAGMRQAAAPDQLLAFELGEPPGSAGRLPGEGVERAGEPGGDRLGPVESARQAKRHATAQESGRHPRHDPCPMKGERQGEPRQAWRRRPKSRSSRTGRPRGKDHAPKPAADPAPRPLSPSLPARSCRTPPTRRNVLVFWLPIGPKRLVQRPILAFGVGIALGLEKRH